MSERDPTRVSLILAAEKHAEVYEAEQRTIVADIMNAFFAGAKWQAALADRPEQTKRVSLGWARLDSAGDICELNSDEQTGMMEIYRDARCTCTPADDEHGIGCEMGGMTAVERAKVQACLGKLLPSDRPEQPVARVEKDHPEPAQPVAHIPVEALTLLKGRVRVTDVPLYSYAFDGSIALYAAPPSHPAPSEAWAERQEYWCPFKDSVCGDDPAKRCADCAQPAKGDA